MATFRSTNRGPAPRAPNIPYFTPLQPINPGTPIDPNDSTPTLFTPLTIRSVTLRNRFIVAPMCQFSCSAFPPQTGQLTDYHIATLGHYALKGAALVFIEATGVQPHGRITPHCPGLWEDAQIDSIKRVADFVKSQGALCGIQLGHAGRKSCSVPPWIARQLGLPLVRADESFGGWPDDVVGVMGGPENSWNGSVEDGGSWPPRQISREEIQKTVEAFGDSARRAVMAGVDVIEIHAAHGYLISQFMSPITNQRNDEYGGSFENRIRLLVEVIQSIRSAIPDTMPLFLRISATEWMDQSDLGKAYGSWDIDSSIRLAKLLPGLGIDLLDVSSGGNHSLQRINMFDSKDYQTRIAGKIKQEIAKEGLKLLVGAVGLITKPQQAKDIVQIKANTVVNGEQSDSGQLSETDTKSSSIADVILVGRQFLREPHWVLKVASELDVDVAWPTQFAKAKLKFS